MTTAEKIAKLNAFLSSLDLEIVEVNGDDVFIRDHENDTEAVAKCFSLPESGAEWEIY